MGNANPISKGFPSVLAVLDRVQLTARQVSKDVTLWPLVLPGDGRAGGEPELWPLEEALEDGFVGVAGDAEGGLVRLESRAPAPVWVPAGERLGGAGYAAESRILVPHAVTAVRARGGEAPCARCCRALATNFHAVDDQVGFVVSVQDRAVGLELALPAGLLARRFGRRVEAWAPWLLALEDSGEAEGLDSPEALLAAVRAGRHLGGRARAEIVSGDPRVAFTM